jgi:hypothetical protein
MYLSGGVLRCIFVVSEGNNEVKHEPRIMKQEAKSCFHLAERLAKIAAHARQILILMILIRDPKRGAPGM